MIRTSHARNLDGVPKATEIAMGPDERLLRDIFRVFPLPRDAVSDTKGQRRRLDEQAFELVLEVVRHAG